MDDRGLGDGQASYDLLTINLNNHDLDAARRRIDLYMNAYAGDGTRMTRNLDFVAGPDEERGGHSG